MPNRCKNGGVCHQPGRCECPEGYSGRFCDEGKVWMNSYIWYVWCYLDLSTASIFNHLTLFYPWQSGSSFSLIYWSRWLLSELYSFYSNLSLILASSWFVDQVDSNLSGDCWLNSLIIIWAWFIDQLDSNVSFSDWADWFTLTYGLNDCSHLFRSF